MRTISTYRKSGRFFILRAINTSCTHLEDHTCFARSICPLSPVFVIGITQQESPKRVPHPCTRSFCAGQGGAPSFTLLQTASEPLLGEAVGLRDRADR